MDSTITKDIVKSVDALDMVGGSLAKPMVERIASPIVGNGNVVSGVAKLGIAVGVAKYGGNNRIGKAVAIGAGMDGAEDLIVSFGKKAGLGTTESTQAGVF